MLHFYTNVQWNDDVLKYKIDIIKLGILLKTRWTNRVLLVLLHCMIQYNSFNDLVYWKN